MHSMMLRRTYRHLAKSLPPRLRPMSTRKMKLAVLPGTVLLRPIRRPGNQGAREQLTTRVGLLQGLAKLQGKVAKSLTKKVESLAHRTPKEARLLPLQVKTTELSVEAILRAWQIDLSEVRTRLSLAKDRHLSPAEPPLMSHGGASTTKHRKKVTKRRNAPPGRAEHFGEVLGRATRRAKRVQPASIKRSCLHSREHGRVRPHILQLKVA
ncbi:unnamed protein product, partial [Arabidopsis thaliana]